jgi:DNA-binding NtrC family response regulator
MERPTGPAGPDVVARLLAVDLAEEASKRTAPSSDDGVSLEAGLDRLLDAAERHWILEAIRQYPTAKRAELARVLKISESALYKKLRQHGIAG